MSSQDKNYLIGFLSSLIVYIIFFGALALLVSKKPTLKESRRVVNIGQITEEKTTPSPNSEAAKPQKRVIQKVQKAQKAPAKQATLPKDTKKIKTYAKEQNATTPPSTQKLSPEIMLLSKQMENARKKGSGGGDGMIRDLYGSEFDKMGKEEQKFIEDNLGGMGRAMQKYFDKVNRFNPSRETGRAEVEFDLYPNGDIRELRITKSSGYRLQDKNALETVELAFKDFPRPKTKTKIRWGFIIY